jgi:hypothetical protein
MAKLIEIPDFEFTANYYPELLDALTVFRRNNVPEITDETAFEPFNQLLRAFALVGHLNNVLLDLVANESTLPTAQLVETVRNMLRLIDYEMSPATPSQVDMILKLSKVFTVTQELVPQFSQAATKRLTGQSVVSFEALTALSITPTNVVTSVFGYDVGTDVFTDFTTEANDVTTPAGDFTPWVDPVDPGDILYIGHDSVMWDKLDLTLTTAADGLTGVWEFYDGDPRDIQPDTVVDQGATLRMNVNGLLGLVDRAGAVVRVQLNETTAFENVASSWDGSDNFIITTGLLGQTIVSTDIDDYTVGTLWTEVRLEGDETANLTIAGAIDIILPQTLEEDWNKVEVNGEEAFWLRFRVISTVAPKESPDLRTTVISDGKQYAKVPYTQGRRQSDSPLGSSTGLPSQVFKTSRDFFIVGSMEVQVDGETWFLVEDSFLNSRPSDKHYVLTLTENDLVEVRFGDGVTGRIPPVGVNNISAFYRHDAATDGNVGTNTVVIDKSGLSFINGLFNPRPAVGWAAAEGSTPESLEQAKIRGPASLRTREVAIGPQDVENLALTFTDSNGVSPVSRAFAIEEGFGPKTIELVLVGNGGAQLSTTQIDEINLFFNGNRFSEPIIPKRVVANQEVVAVNYNPLLIDIVATVTGEFEVLAVENQLEKILQPDSLREDGTTYEWQFGTEVPRSRLIHEIFDTDGDITKVVLTTPVIDVDLDTRQLPSPGSIIILKAP